MISSKFLFFVISYANPLKIHLFYMKMFYLLQMHKSLGYVRDNYRDSWRIPEAVSTPYRYVKSPFSSFLLSRGVRFFTEKYHRARTIFTLQIFQMLRKFYVEH